MEPADSLLADKCLVKGKKKTKPQEENSQEEYKYNFKLVFYCMRHYLSLCRKDAVHCSNFDGRYHLEAFNTVNTEDPAHCTVFNHTFNGHVKTL